MSKRFHIQFPGIIVLLFMAIIVHASAAKDKPVDKTIAGLEKKLEQALGNDRVDVLNNLVKITWKREPQKAVKRGEEAIALARANGYDKGLAIALKQTSHPVFMAGEWEKALDYRVEALGIFKRLNLRGRTAFVLADIGDFYRQRRFYNIALRYFLDALEIFKETQNQKGLTAILWHLGNLYLNKRNPDKALKYFLEALNMLEKSQSKGGIVLYMQSVGHAYLALKDYPKALEYFRASLAEAEKVCNRRLISANLDNIGLIFIKLHQPDEALSCLLKSKTILDDINDQDGVPYNLLYTGQAYTLKKEFKKGLDYFDRALKAAMKAVDKDAVENIYKAFADTYSQTGDCNQSLRYYQLQWKIKEEIFNQNHDRQFEELQAQFKADQQDKHIQLLANESKIRGMAAKVSILGFLLVSIVLGFLLKRYLYLFAFWKKQKYVGQYRLLEPIGAGGMGTVFKAHRIRDKNDLAAVKVLRDELAEDPINRRRFKREGSISDDMEHPNIVRIFERGEYKGKLFIAMELLSGTTLERQIKEKGAIGLSLAVPVMIQITRALVFVHAKNVVHRDLKPANIMLIKTGEQPGNGSTDLFPAVKLLDFGLALVKFHSRLTNSGILVGTIHYIAPEQITESSYTAAGDIYALGMIFYQILTGVPAFPGDNLTAVVEKILDTPPIAPRHLSSQIPPGLDQLILSMLEKDPKNRPTAPQVLDALESLRNPLEQS